MSRGLSTANRNASQASPTRPAYFAEFDFVGGVVRLWTGRGDLALSGIGTFTGLGTLGPISGIAETTHLEARNLSFSLSGIPTAIVAAISAVGNRTRSCKLWMGFLNPQRTALVDDPILRFAGRMDQISITDQGETSTITIPAEDLLALLTRPRPIRLSHEEQQRRFPGDLGLEYLVQTSTRTIHMGPGAPAPLPYRRE